MGVKVTSDIPNVATFANKIKNAAVARRANDWENKVDAILRAQPKNVQKLAGKITTEITADGFTGTSDSDGMKYIEFGMDECPMPDNLVAGMATIEQIAPMRRALATL